MVATAMLVADNRLHMTSRSDEGGVMKLYEAYVRVCSSTKRRLPFRSCLLILLLLVCTGPWQPACAQQPGTFASITNAPLGTEQIVKNLVGMNLERAQALHAYHGTRTYRVGYHGRIWVDAEDFAVVRLEAQPAKSPSFWTKNSEVVQVYMKVSDFWLPARNHSIAAIRLGGRAELTIQYNNYQITSADPIGSLS